MNDFEGQMNELFGGNRANYSVEDIEAAKKRQKKYGGTLYENLTHITEGRNGEKPLSYMKGDQDPFKPEGILNGTSGDKMPGIQNPGLTETGIQNQQLTEQRNQKPGLEDISSTLNELNRNLKSDFKLEGTGIIEDGNSLKSFDGLREKLLEKIYGEDEYIKKLIIAFKRPFVTERDENDALNGIYISGPEDTGRHYSLTLITKELSDRKLLVDPSIYRMDLSLYPTQAEEKLFIMDLYSALNSISPVILFENYANCNVAFLGRLFDLVNKGETMLNERYTMQNNQLVSVNNALAGDTISSLTAKGKYLVFMGTESLTKLADIMGAPFINSLGDICVTEALSSDAVERIAKEQEELLRTRVKKQLDYELSIDESFEKHILSQTSKGRALKGVIDACEDAFKALTEYRLESENDALKEITLKCDGEIPRIVSGENSVPLTDFLQVSYSGELAEVEADLENIVGLTEIKKYIRSLKEYYEIQKQRRDQGLKAGELNRHMIFTGNPGTGKTTIARIVSRYLKAIGILSGGQLVEVSRGDLVGRYVGHTAPLVNQVVKSALGGVLFIDEAYSLYRGGEDSFGLEAIDTLVKAIEDNRDDLVVILAGYSKEMSEFLEANSGLKSRFPNIIDFPDYTAEELLAIAHITAKSKGYVIDKDAEGPLRYFFAETQLLNAREAGNGRLVRNKIEEAILNQSRRLIAEPDADISLLMKGDFELPINEEAQADTEEAGISENQTGTEENGTKKDQPATEETGIPKEADDNGDTEA
ncbi:MAG: AAA family ATPase [Lachnospiraceae bacterium]|nr:AAA family ATPase [Lachnospiraceae bacterium]